MSYFGNELAELLKKKNINQTEFSKLTGYSQAHISKLINGEQTWVSAEDMDIICSTVTRDKIEQARLVRAHLLDECHGPGSELINIQITNEPLELKEKPAPYRGPLPIRFAQALEILAEQHHDKSLRTVIEGLAGLMSDE